MATSRGTSECVDHFNCPVCIEKFEKPRSLPTCLHTFCENCLFTFVFNLKKNDHLGTTFECPVCRKPHASPENGEVTLEWIQTFPLNHMVVSMMDSSKTEPDTGIDAEMDCAKSEMCDPCQEEGESNIGLKYCLDCQESLCDMCVNHHKKFKQFKNHKLISKEKMKENQSYAIQYARYSKCPKHMDRDVELYCKDDDSLCCIKCVTVNHRSCREVIELADTGGQAKEDANQLEIRLKTAKKHLNMLKTLKGENIRILKAKLEETPNKVRKLRDDLAKKLDDWVDLMIAKTKAMTKAVEITNEEDVKRIEGMLDEADKKTELLETMVKFGSDSHIFISVQNMNREFKELEANIIKEDSNHTTLDINLNISEELSNFSEKGVETIGDIKLLENKSNHEHCISLNSCKIVKKEIHQISFNNGCSPSSRGMSVYKNQLVLSDLCGVNKTCGFIYIYNLCEHKSRKLKMRQPFSAAFIDNDHIAVSRPNDKNICFVSVTSDEMKVEKSLLAKTQPKRLVALKNGQLAVSWENPPAFGIVDVSGAEIIENTYLDRDKKGRKFNTFEYLAVDELRSHVIQPCTKDKAVYCFDYAREPVFKYTDSSLKFPRGVALDREGNIYVCEYNDNTIHRLSSGGQQICIIKEDIPKRPLAICFETFGTKFWVTQNASDFVHCYELVKK